jgi:hypothetical protein
MIANKEVFFKVDFPSELISFIAHVVLLSCRHGSVIECMIPRA